MSSKEPVKLRPSELKLAVAGPSVSAGFPSPADDFKADELSLDELLVKHPQATFFWRVRGNSMVDAYIHDGDILIVDTAVTARNKNLVIVAINGEYVVKRLSIGRGGKISFLSENPDFPAITPGEEESVQIWGVVRHIIKDADRV